MPKDLGEPARFYFGFGPTFAVGVWVGSLSQLHLPGSGLDLNELQGKSPGRDDLVLRD